MTTNNCPHCGATLFGNVARCYKCKGNIDLADKVEERLAASAERMYGEQSRKDEIINTTHSLVGAVQHDNIDQVKRFIEEGAIVDHEVLGIGRALDYACMGGRLEIVKLLIDSGSDVNYASDGYCNTVLMQAASAGHLETVKYLLDCGAKVAAKDKNGRTALSFAEYSGHDAIISLLREAARPVGRIRRFLFGR